MNNLNNVANTLIQQLEQNQVLIAWGVPGGAWVEFDQALANSQIKYIPASSEAVATFAASAYKYILAKKGMIKESFAIVTSGPGLCVSVNGVGNAFQEEWPLLLIVGQTFPDSPLYFQHISTNLLIPITKNIAYIQPNGQGCNNIIASSLQVVNQGTTNNPGFGPAAIVVSSNSWFQPCSGTTPNLPYQPRNTDPILQVANQLSNPNLKIVIRLGDRLTRASPLIKQYCEKLLKKRPGTLFTVTFGGNGLLPLGFPNNLCLDGIFGTQTAFDALNTADLILSFGLGVQYVNTTLIPNLNTKIPVIQIFDDYKNTDAVTIFTKAIDLIYPISTTPSVISWSQKLFLSLPASIEIMYAQYQKLPDGDMGKVVSSTMKQVCKSDAIQVLDVGSVWYVANQFAYVPNSYQLMVTSSYSPIGVAMPVASGVTYALPGSKIIVWLGDGGFLNLPNAMFDLVAGAKENKCQVLVLLVNNREYGAVALAELEVFQTTTPLVSTTYLLDNINLETIFQGAGFDQVTTLPIEQSQELPKLAKSWLENENNPPTTCIIANVIPARSLVTVK